MAGIPLARKLRMLRRATTPMKPQLVMNARVQTKNERALKGTVIKISIRDGKGVASKTPYLVEWDETKTRTWMSRNDIEAIPQS